MAMAGSLCGAAATGDLNVIHEMMARGRSVDERDTHQNTPLHHACLAGNLPVVEGLLSYGADVNAVNLHGKSCLQFAAHSGDTRIIYRLLDDGANVKHQSKDGKTALHSAVSNDFPDASRILIEAGCGVDLAENEGNTPLHKATQKDFVECIELLRSYGANQWTRNKSGQSSVDIARDNKLTEALQALMSVPLPKSHWTGVPDDDVRRSPTRLKSAASAVTQVQQNRSSSSAAANKNAVLTGDKSTEENTTNQLREMLTKSYEIGSSHLNTTTSTANDEQKPKKIENEPVQAAQQPDQPLLSNAEPTNVTSSSNTTAPSSSNTTAAAPAEPVIPPSLVSYVSESSLPDDAALDTAPATSSQSSSSGKVVETPLTLQELLSVPGVRHVSIFPFFATRPDELSFNVNEQILVLKRFDDGWCLGEHNGLLGMFPAKYARLELRPQHTVASPREGTSAPVPVASATSSSAPSSSVVSSNSVARPSVMQHAAVVAAYGSVRPAEAKVQNLIIELTATLDRKLSPFLAAVAATPAVETRAYDTSLKAIQRAGNVALALNKDNADLESTLLSDTLLQLTTSWMSSREPLLKAATKQLDAALAAPLIDKAKELRAVLDDVRTAIGVYSRLLAGKVAALDSVLANGGDEPTATASLERAALFCVKRYSSVEATLAWHRSQTLHLLIKGWNEWANQLKAAQEAALKATSSTIDHLNNILIEDKVAPDGAWLSDIKLK